MIVPFVGSRASEHKFSYSVTNWAAVPMMFGISNSAFGCHETLPSLLFPISQKRHNFTMLALTFGGIMLLYFSLSTTALISFDGDLIADVYLLNFQVKTRVKGQIVIFILEWLRTYSITKTSLSIDILSYYTCCHQFYYFPHRLPAQYQGFVRSWRHNSWMAMGLWAISNYIFCFNVSRYFWVTFWWRWSNFRNRRSSYYFSIFLPLSNTYGFSIS